MEDAGGLHVKIRYVKKRRDGLFCAHHKKILKSKKNNKTIANYCGEIYYDGSCVNVE